MIYNYITYIVKYKKDRYCLNKELEEFETRNKDNSCKSILISTPTLNIIGITIGIGKQNMNYLVNTIFSDFEIILKSKIKPLDIDIKDIIKDLIFLDYKQESTSILRGVAIDSIINTMCTNIEIDKIVNNKNNQNNIDVDLDSDIKLLKVNNELDNVKWKVNKSYSKIFEGNGDSIMSKLSKLEEQQIQDDKDITEIKNMLKSSVPNEQFNLLNLFLKSNKKQLFSFLFIIIVIVSISQTYLLPKLEIIVEEASKEILK